MADGEQFTVRDDVSFSAALPLRLAAVLFIAPLAKVADLVRAYPQCVVTLEIRRDGRDIYVADIGETTIRMERVPGPGVYPFDAWVDFERAVKDLHRD
jgi:hypothetical protein